jgi:hypothetical protein
MVDEPMKARARIALLGGVVLLAAGCGSSSGSGTTMPTTSASASGTGGATVSTGTVKGVGTVLVDSRGRTLYLRAGQALEGDVHRVLRDGVATPEARLGPDGDGIRPGEGVDARERSRPGGRPCRHL